MPPVKPRARSVGGAEEEEEEEEEDIDADEPYERPLLLERGVSTGDERARERRLRGGVCRSSARSSATSRVFIIV